MKKQLLPYLFFLLFVFASGNTFTQQKEYIVGKLLDAKTHEPIAFAGIRIKDRALGVISNVDGTFKIPLRYKELGETLEISCMGFESKQMDIQDLNKPADNVITLNPGGFELAEAVVTAKIKRLSAKQIVRIAVNRIQKNYPQGNFGLVGYYRDYQVKNGTYTNLNEAIIKVWDEGFGKETSFHNQYQLLSYDKNPHFEIDVFAKQPYDYKDYNKIVPNAKMQNDGGNELITLTMHDPIRNYKKDTFSFIDRIRSDFIANHRFRLLGKSNYKEESVYAIEITFSNDHYRARGKIFVNTTDFSIHKLNYALYKLENKSFALDQKKPSLFDYSIAYNASERFSDGFNRTDTELMYRIEIEYVRDMGGKMFLNYISFYNKVLVQRPAEFESKFLINLEDRSFRIKLNKLPANMDKIAHRHFKIKYDKRMVPVKEFYFLEDERTFVVCPDLDYQETEDLFQRFSYSVADVSYKYGFIDEEGNKVDEREWEYLHQYRQFFTQEILSEEELFPENGLMIKTMPLDHPSQPIKEGGMKGKYWKNTPLPTFFN